MATNTISNTANSVFTNAQANLAVFEHFRPQLAGRRVVVVGRYPGLHEWAARHDLRMDVLEREPAAGEAYRAGVGSALNHPKEKQP